MVSIPAVGTTTVKAGKGLDGLHPGSRWRWRVLESGREGVPADAARLATLRLMLAAAHIEARAWLRTVK
jgi:hypothetical protein